MEFPNTRANHPAPVARFPARAACGLLAALLTIAACGWNPLSRREPLPEIPQPDTEGFLPAIKKEIEKLYAEAKARPEDADAVGELGMLLHAHRQNSTAEVCYRRAVGLAPQEFKWRYYLGQVQTAQGKSQEALANLLAALKLRPDYVPCLLKIADVLIDLGRVDEAGEYYRRAAKEDPGAAAAWFGIGRVHAAKGELKEAAKAYEKACELFPEYGSAHYALALAYRRLGRLKEAKPHFELSEKYKHLIPPANDKLMADIRRRDRGAVEMIRLAIALEQEGKLREALKLHEQALKIDPTLAQVHVNLMSLYGRLGNRKKAEEHYRAAMALNPNMADCHYNFGVLAYEEGRLDEAEAAFRKAIEINPFYADAHNNLGVLLERQGRLAEAEKHYRQAVENRPGFALARFHLGRLLVARGNLTEGIRHLEAAVKNEKKDNPVYLYALGAAYARAGKYQAAGLYLRRARKAAQVAREDRLLRAISSDLKRLELISDNR